MNHEFETSLDLNVTVEVKGYTKSRPAPHCSNPDHPNYSDPGDGPDWKDYKVILSRFDMKTKKSKSIDITEYLPDYILQSLEQEIVEEGEQAARDAEQDRLVEMYESRQDR